MGGEVLPRQGNTFMSSVSNWRSYIEIRLSLYPGCMGALMSDYCSDAASDQGWIITTSGVRTCI
ncbi:hypothetical protein KC19_4G199800 [Ceratodon purpureus]|uniref:Uncharacterized protein n=1 Tax=Ceratodon purpureus TaxID=3225 RepID=A0A8T0IE81_CERPU|nr:hypothetical protein KC19_4G199800 [Ceratodon purpureus]